jgi:hypothetical protein
LAEIRALYERIRHGDESGTVAWEEVGPNSAYRVRLDPRVQRQLRDARPQLQGFVAGMIALLRTDPTSASAACPVTAAEDFIPSCSPTAADSWTTRSSRTASSSSSMN